MPESIPVDDEYTVESVGLDDLAGDLEADLLRLQPVYADKKEATFQRTHDEEVELWLIWVLTAFIGLSFLFLAAAYFVPSQCNEGPCMTTPEYAQTAGNTSLGALVALLAGRRKKSSD